MSYWKLFYHFVWATKQRQPLITPKIEPMVHNYLRVKALGLEAKVFAVNGTEDHVHMVVTIPPKLAVATFIGQVKAVASAKLNQLVGEGSLFWQDEYGVFSFDAKRLPNYVAYVENKKTHHAQHSVIPILERTIDEDVKAMRDDQPIYGFESSQWREELIAMPNDLS